MLVFVGAPVQTATVTRTVSLTGTAVQTTRRTATPRTAATGGVARCRGRAVTATPSVTRSGTAAATTSCSASTRSQQQQHRQLQWSTPARGDAALARAGPWSQPSVTVTLGVSVWGTAVQIISNNVRRRPRRQSPPLLDLVLGSVQIVCSGSL